MKTKLLYILGLSIVLTWTTAARAGTYLDTAALLLDETHRSGDWMQTHLLDLKLAEIAHQLSEARVKCGRLLLVPKEVERAHPHLLLALEASERAMAAALEGEPEKFMRFVLQVRDEERTFRAILNLQKFSLPEIEKDRK